MYEIAFQDYRNCFDPNKVLEVDSTGILNKNVKFFNDQSLEFIEKIRLNYYELKKNRDDPNYYLIDIVEKLNIIKKELFIIHKDVVLYRPKKSIIVKPLQEGDLLSEAANAQFLSLENMILHYNLQLIGNTVNPINRLKEFNVGAKLDQAKLKKIRKSEEQTFVLSHESVNLKVVYEILLTNGFIWPDTQFDNFKMVFKKSVDPLQNKVVWIHANALHYFIKRIYNEGGVEKAKEGMWNRTIKCFKNPNGDYKVEDLKNTHEPIARETKILDLAIDLFINPK